MKNRLTLAPGPNWLAVPSTASDGRKMAGIISGYGAVFFDDRDREGTQFNLHGNIFERISPRAFDRTLSDKLNVRLCFNHASDNVLSSTYDGSLKLTVDQRGLKFTAEIADTQLGRDVVELVRRATVRGCSFMFSPLAEKWHKVGDAKICEITDCELHELGPVTFPAYGSTPVWVELPKPSEPTAPSRLSPAEIDDVIETDYYRKAAAARLAKQRQRDRDLLQIEN